MNYPEKKLWLTAMLAGAMIVFSGCCPTTSLHPLSNPDSITSDERLFGTWGLANEGSTAFLHIGRGEDGYTEIQYVEHKQDARLDIVSFLTFPSLIDDDSFLNVEPAELSEGDFEGYIFIHYELLDDNRLSLSGWDEPAIEQAIEDELIRGEIIEKQEEYTGLQGQPIQGKSKCVRITDETDNIISFIRQYGARKLFNQPMGIFERVVLKQGDQNSNP